jgi:hypothetical protein
VGPDRRRPLIRWSVTAVATAVSVLALDAVATGFGVVLVATGVLAGVPLPALVAVLVASYGAWVIGLRSNLSANADLLAATGASTNALSKLCFDAARRRGWSDRVTRRASGTGYVALEAAKELPYYVGAFGSALVASSVGAAEAVVFLVGTNLGAAGWELGVARLTHRGLAWRSRKPGLRTP